ncbi:NAD-dependent deacetylase, putative [Entamoeba invadens IP1]|uniref:NAD-dependent deacetylase, putative n=1 Tax=Entamoeba invadens IP1 TaxID=370355 RepID=A0A0A1TWD3_ENTIV|nr:NAD-dependent deacetylase, putative [Entamoeba invadens IP1]ELP84946.1 NAD-dependent deacetylase, putative [Entamoeba invadens IP1]|eukprot:XP_004184292.1 NAD-dependent deacetylase, putative [Entamoeba invadens IP1]
MEDFMSEMSEEELDLACRALARTIARSQRVVVLTGAGISVSAGIPDFRSKGGMWTRYDPKVYANYNNFLAHPEMFWKMSTELRVATSNKQPTKAHFALERLQRMGKLSSLITQNVDNLHQLSGVENVIELHGTGKICHCIQCDYKGNIDVVLPQHIVPWIDIPRCPVCGALIKLDVVLFGEPLQSDNFQRAFTAASSADVFLVIGSSLEVMPANQLPRRAKMSSSTVAFINKSSTRYDDFTDYTLRGDSDVLVPKLVDYVAKYMDSLCMDNFIDIVTFPLKVISSPFDALTQFVTFVAKWATPVKVEEDIPKQLVDSSEVVEQALTNPITHQVEKKRSKSEERKAEDKVMEEINQSLRLRSTEIPKESQLFN